MVKKSKNLIVVKSNEFVEASYKITLDEMRVLLLTIGSINSKSEDHRRDFEFTVAEFAERFDTDEKSAYKQVQKAIDMLGSRWALVESTAKYDRKVT
ncbi:replication initiation protein, partial [Gallibacterium genomosp. 3]